ncbi:hypothetical protein EBR03_01605 [bacterium]|nr:hypothetical protein [bacterium]
MLKTRRLSHQGFTSNSNILVYCSLRELMPLVFVALSFLVLAVLSASDQSPKSTLTMRKTVNLQGLQRGFVRPRNYSPLAFELQK